MRLVPVEPRKAREPDFDFRQELLSRHSCSVFWACQRFATPLAFDPLENQEAAVGRPRSGKRSRPSLAGIVAAFLQGVAVEFVDGRADFPVITSLLALSLDEPVLV